MGLELRRRRKQGFVIRTTEPCELRVSVLEVMWDRDDDVPVVVLKIDGRRDVVIVKRDELLTREESERWLPLRS